MITARVHRFLSVGVLATLAHLLAAIAAQSLLDMPAQLANLLGFCTAFGLSYAGHARFTFQVVGNHDIHAQRFLFVSLAGLASSAGITHLVHTSLGAPFAVAMIAVGICVPVLTYVVSKMWTFAEVVPRKSGYWHGVFAAMGFGLLCFAVLQGRLINHDTAWYLVATRKWLEGARLYVDLVEVNPPLNFYLTAPAIWVADSLGVADIRAQILLTCGVLTLSLLWVWELLHRTDEMTQRHKLGLLAGACFALTVPFVQDFAQREHTLVIVLLPYVFGLALSGSVVNSTRSGEAARAVFAGIGLCLKPHFMLIPIANTVALCARTRSVRPMTSVSNLVLLTMGLGYVVLVKLWHPEYLDVIVPMAAKVYGAYGFSMRSVIETASPALIVAFALLALAAVRDSAPRGFDVVFAATAACLIIYIAQWTGYGYQITPAFSLIAIASFWVLSRPASSVVVRVLALACLGLICVNSARIGLYRSPATTLFQPYLESAGAERRLAVFSSSLWPSFPLVLDSGGEWTSRYPALWLIPGALNRLQSTACKSKPADCLAVEGVLAQTRADVVTDFVGGAADLLLVDKNPFYIDDPDFSYVEFFSEDPRFLPHFQQYELIDVKSGFEIYRKKSP
ncbi:putative flippase GtrA [Litoreibacter meonggei]|uniref:Putative flippase GtrA n=1 Tax=Litoreibacter meonggei TaxID=1049199 RepID=A0A497X419_9RHOB|nr:GtrA family protein [Litoreibacter meonggei]RLJ59184.1 putative flippase GtrA [Litoreibacter meonggei]